MNILVLPSEKAVRGKIAVAMNISTGNKVVRFILFPHRAFIILSF